MPREALCLSGRATGLNHTLLLHTSCTSSAAGKSEEAWLPSLYVPICWWHLTAVLTALQCVTEYRKIVIFHLVVLLELNLYPKVDHSSHAIFGITTSLYNSGLVPGSCNSRLDSSSFRMSYSVRGFSGPLQRDVCWTLLPVY